MILITRVKVAYLFVSWWFPILPGHVRKGKMNWHSNTFPIGKLTLKWPQVTPDDPKWPKLSFRSSATTTLRPNIAIVRDSGTTQTIVNNAIVNNGSRVPISRNIVKNMEPVRDHIARVNTVILVSVTSWYWWLKFGDNFLMQNFWTKMIKTVTNIWKLSSTLFVSNIRHLTFRTVLYPSYSLRGHIKYKSNCDKAKQTNYFGYFITRKLSKVSDKENRFSLCKNSNLNCAIWINKQIFCDLLRTGVRGQ